LQIRSAISTAERLVAGAEALGDRHQVWRDAFLLAVVERSVRPSRSSPRRSGGRDRGCAGHRDRPLAEREIYDVALAPHCPNGPISLAASFQVGFCCLNAAIQEQSLGRTITRVMRACL
jgi:hypothetical protein